MWTPTGCTYKMRWKPAGVRLGNAQINSGANRRAGGGDRKSGQPASRDAHRGQASLSVAALINVTAAHCLDFLQQSRGESLRGNSQTGIPASHAEDFHERLQRGRAARR